MTPEPKPYGCAGEVAGAIGPCDGPVEYHVVTTDGMVGWFCGAHARALDVLSLIRNAIRDPAAAAHARTVRAEKRGNVTPPRGRHMGTK